MDARQRENLRRAILTVMEANGSRFGLGVAAVTLHVSAFGFPEIEDRAVRPEIEYLADKGLIVGVDKKLSPENALWRITAEGRDFLASRAG